MSAELWNIFTVALAVAVVLALTGPWGLAVVVALPIVVALYRAVALEQLRLRMVAAQEAANAALERQHQAEAEAAHAWERAREAGWMVPTSEDFSVN